MRRRFSSLHGFTLVLGSIAGLSALSGELTDAPTTVIAGPLRFEERLVLGDYGYAYGIASADLARDGDIDLTSADTTNDLLYWFENDGHGRLSRHLIFEKDPGWFERHAIGDLDQDGDPDVAVVKNKAHDVLWFENSGVPRSDRIWKRHVIAKGSLPFAYDVTLGDFDADGDLDLAGSTYTGGNLFAWFENPGKPRVANFWKKHMIEEEIGGTRTIVAVDLNRDGQVDLLGSARVAGVVLWYENTGLAEKRWRKRIIDDKASLPTHGHPIDMDGDGDLDIIMAFGHNAKPTDKNTNHVAWYENVGAPGSGKSWKKHRVGDLPVAFEAVAGDLDGDGDMDVVSTAWGAESGRIVWFEQRVGTNGQPEWKLYDLKNPWPKANSVVLVDLDQDGRLDIAATAERGANEFRWWRNASGIEE